MGTMRKDQLVTKEDLEIFKVELIAALRKVISDGSSHQSKRWLKTAEARKLLGFSPGKLQTVRDNGMLAFTKIGGNIYYNEDDLFKLFDEHKKQREK